MKNVMLIIVVLVVLAIVTIVCTTMISFGISLFGNSSEQEMFALWLFLVGMALTILFLSICPNIMRWLNKKMGLDTHNPGRNLL
jgi:hypothetical protein